jgi:hypothetical protein
MSRRAVSTSRLDVTLDEGAAAPGRRGGVSSGGADLLIGESARATGKPPRRLWSFVKRAFGVGLHPFAHPSRIGSEPIPARVALTMKIQTWPTLGAAF